MFFPRSIQKYLKSEKDNVATCNTMYNIIIIFNTGQLEVMKVVQLM